MGGLLQLKERWTDSPTEVTVGVYYLCDHTGKVLATYPQKIYPASKPSFPSVERTWSQGHPGPPYREGGPFATVSVRDPYAWDHRGGGVYTQSWGKSYYQGSFHPKYWFKALETSLDVATILSTSWTDFGDPLPYGPDAWNRYKPGKSVVSLGQSIAEARDVVPMVKRTAKGFRDLWRDFRRLHYRRNAKWLADHWLNTQFGWLPFLGDVLGLYRVYKHHEEFLRRVRRENNRWVKRGGTVLEHEDTVTAVDDPKNTGHYPVLSSYLYSNPPNTGSHQLLVTYRKKVWFEAAFKYWIPNMESVAWKRSYLMSLMGLNVSPELVWEVTPWSWLIDWYTNVGSSLGNISNGWADNLVAKYAFVMCKNELVYTLNSVCNLHSLTLNDSWDYTVTSKRRTMASPVGFNLTPSDLTARQISILGALGISRNF